MMEILELFFDGSCEPKNPGGVASCGFVVYQGGELIKQSCCVVAEGKRATNNFAEWCALGKGLRWLFDNQNLCGGNILKMYGDSKLVVNQLTGEWRCNKDHLRKLRDRCRELLEGLPLDSWEITWIQRWKNEEADKLSRMAYEKHTGRSYPQRKRKFCIRKA